MIIIGWQEFACECHHAFYWSGHSGWWNASTSPSWMPGHLRCERSLQSTRRTGRWVISLHITLYINPFCNTRILAHTLTLNSSSPIQNTTKKSDFSSFLFLFFQGTILVSWLRLWDPQCWQESSLWWLLWLLTILCGHTCSTTENLPKLHQPPWYVCFLSPLLPQPLLVCVFVCVSWYYLLTKRRAVKFIYLSFQITFCHNFFNYHFCLILFDDVVGAGIALEKELFDAHAERHPHPHPRGFC